MKAMPYTTGGIAPGRARHGAMRIAAAIAMLVALDHVTRVDAAAPPQQTTLADLATHVATSDSFYLFLNAARGELTLELRGAVLHTYQPLAIQVGRRRVAWVRSAPPVSFEAARWRHGQLTPPRPEERLAVVPGAAESLLVEQMRAPGPGVTPAPESFWITFEGDRELLIDVEEPEDTGTAHLLSRMKARLHTFRQALRGRGERWRVTLPREQADHLYRSLPPDTWLLIYCGPSKPPS